MIYDWIEFVPLQPVFVIDQRAVAPQFLDKDPIAQPLRGLEVTLVRGDPDLEEIIIWRHATE